MSDEFSDPAGTEYRRMLDEKDEEIARLKQLYNADHEERTKLVIKIAKLRYVLKNNVDGYVAYEEMDALLNEGNDDEEGEHDE